MVLSFELQQFHGYPANLQCDVVGRTPSKLDSLDHQMLLRSPAILRGVQAHSRKTTGLRVADKPDGIAHKVKHRLHGADRYFFESTAARNRSSDSTSAGSATVSAISWRKSSRYLLRSL